MNCDEALLAISAALDGELLPREQAELSAHLLSCPACREVAEDLRALNDLLQDSELDPPAELAASIREAVAAQAPPAPKKRRPPYLRAVAAMLALCLLLGGVGLFSSGGTNKSSGPDEAAPAMFKAPPESRSYDGWADAGSAAYSDGEGPVSNSEEEAAPMEPAAPPTAGRAGQGENALNHGQMDAGDAVSGLIETPLPPESTTNDEDKAGGLTPEQALELVFQHVGGYEQFPDARQRRVSTAGFDAPAYCLKTEETDAASTEYCLDYVGAGYDGVSWRFHLFELVTGEQEDGSVRTATMNWYTVSPDGAITAELPETAAG